MAMRLRATSPPGGTLTEIPQNQLPTFRLALPEREVPSVVENSLRCLNRDGRLDIAAVLTERVAQCESF
jgi:hypothetical protein